MLFSKMAPSPVCGLYEVRGSAGVRSAARTAPAGRGARRVALRLEKPTAVDPLARPLRRAGDGRSCSLRASRRGAPGAPVPRARAHRGTATNAASTSLLAGGADASSRARQCARAARRPARPPSRSDSPPEPGGQATHAPRWQWGGGDGGGEAQRPARSACVHTRDGRRSDWSVLGWQQMEKDNANTLKTLDKIPGQNNLKATYSQMLTQSKRKLKMAGCL